MKQTILFVKLKLKSWRLICRKFAWGSVKAVSLIMLTSLPLWMIIKEFRKFYDNDNCNETIAQRSKWNDSIVFNAKNYMQFAIVS